jgi:hypothetical protein
MLAAEKGKQPRCPESMPRTPLAVIAVVDLIVNRVHDLGRPARVLIQAGQF